MPKGAKWQTSIFMGLIYHWFMWDPIHCKRKLFQYLLEFTPFLVLRNSDIATIKETVFILHGARDAINELLEQMLTLLLREEKNAIRS